MEKEISCRYNKFFLYTALVCDLCRLRSYINSKVGHIFSITHTALMYMLLYEHYFSRAKVAEEIGDLVG